MSNRPHFKFREFASLLAVPVILAGTGAFLFKRSQREEARASGPFRVGKTKVVKVPVTPLDVFQGYDSAFLASADYSGVPPKGMYWSENCEKGTTLNRFLIDGVDCDSETKRCRVKVAFKLVKVPKSAPASRVRITWVAKDQKTSRALAHTSMAVDEIVRKKGEAVKLPQVSRYCPLRYIKADVKWDPSTAGQPAYDIVARLQLLDPEIDGDSAKITQVTGTVITYKSGKKADLSRPLEVIERGKKFYESVDCSILDHGYSATTKILLLHWKLFQLKGLYSMKNVIRMETDVSINDSWPTHLAIDISGAK